MGSRRPGSARLWLIVAAWTACAGTATLATAQEGGGSGGVEDAGAAEAEGTAGPEQDDGEFRLQPPSLEPPSITLDEGEEASGEGDDGEAAPAGAGDEASAAGAGRARAGDEEGAGGEATGAVLGDEAERAEQLLREAAPEEADEAAGEDEGLFANLGANVTVSGYLRLRTEWWRDLDLGRRLPPGASDDRPFDAFRSLDAEALPRGGCAGDPATDSGRATPCPGSADLTFGTMRLRLRPVFALGESVRVHTEFDVFDNMVLGSSPGPGALRSLDPGMSPPAFGASMGSAIRVRRAYGEVVHRELGRLRFGRMGWRWGLGMLYDDGEDLDADRQTDVDRIEGTRRFGNYWVRAAWDFAEQGAVRHVGPGTEALPVDATVRDDVDRFVVSVERRFTDREAQEALDEGRWVLEGGLQFAWWSQFLGAEGVDPASPRGEDLVRRDATLYQPDLWLRVRHGGLRLSLEAAALFGSVGNVLAAGFEPEPHDVLQFGAAFEGEYRLLDDKLAFHLTVVAASADPDVDGLSEQDDLVTQQSDDRTVSTFRLHPNYRVDEILWRRILGRVAGALVVRPGVSYDLVRSPFGGLLGGRLDVTYSRALAEVQTYGSDPDLGLELGASIYYRSEDGTSEEDGFHLRAQYSLLLPFAGLGYPTYRGRTPFPSSLGGAPELTTASIFRILAGISF